MRVISGSARRLVLEVPDDKARPTTDRTKETLFNIINDYVYSALVLDLFAGSGALGIESLSRGARHAVFCDNYMGSIKCVKKNLTHTNLIENASILQYDYVKALHLFKEKNQCFDLIFLDPPYNKGIQMETLRLIHQLDILSKKGIIVVESSIDTLISVDDYSSLCIYKEKRFKTNKFTFIERVNE